MLEGHMFAWFLMDPSFESNLLYRFWAGLVKNGSKNWQRCVKRGAEKVCQEIHITTGRKLYQTPFNSAVFTKHKCIFENNIWTNVSEEIISTTFTFSQFLSFFMNKKPVFFCRPTQDIVKIFSQPKQCRTPFPKPRCLASFAVASSATRTATGPGSRSTWSRSTRFNMRATLSLRSVSSAGRTGRPL